ncbi:hypothetical protein [Carnobacterium sp.]|uniref:hypothetical protein n=1 Tax=Carnobacterium sp. TaxID=48221 RepID=UPI003890974A
MLKTTRQITLTGSSMINDQSVVNLTATIPSDTGVSNINQYVQNSSLYEANKAQVRRDIAGFTAQVYEIEDEIVAEAEIVG